MKARDEFRSTPSCYSDLEHGEFGRVVHDICCLAAGLLVGATGTIVLRIAVESYRELHEVA